MAEESAEGGSPAQESAPKKPLPLGLIFVGLNTLALVGVLGLLVYTKLIYKRPPMLENQEREKIAEEEEVKSTEASGVRSMLKLEPIQANLKPSQIGARVEGAPPPQLKPHFLTMTIALELVSIDLEPTVKQLVPKFLDELLQSLGNTTVEQLSTVQGRYILRSKIIGIMNELVKKEKKGSGVAVTNVYFSDFVVQ